ncbi:hypothetical protein ABK040_016087 [Willaertia magna]
MTDSCNSVSTNTLFSSIELKEYHNNNNLNHHNTNHHNNACNNVYNDFTNDDVPATQFEHENNNNTNNVDKSFCSKKTKKYILGFCFVIACFYLIFLLSFFTTLLGLFIQWTRLPLNLNTQEINKWNKLKQLRNDNLDLAEEYNFFNNDFNISNLEFQQLFKEVDKNIGEEERTKNYKILKERNNKDDNVDPLLELRVNQLQVLTTHNSYHQRKQPFSWFIPSMNYEHDTITNQLNNYGVRGLELDIHFNRDTKYWHVYHVPIIDDKSSCNTFMECLKEVKDWSDSVNGNHDLIFIYIEPKNVRDFHDFCKDDKQLVFRKLLEEITSIIPITQILTPAKLKGRNNSLREAINKRGWPKRKRVRGMFTFVMNFWEENKACKEVFISEAKKNPYQYKNQTYTMLDAVFFRSTYEKVIVNKEEDAIFLEVDDARTHIEESATASQLGQFGQLRQGKQQEKETSSLGKVVPKPDNNSFLIKDLVKQGFIVRCATGSREDVEGSALGSSRRRKTEACLLSGAQLISTDYPNSNIVKKYFVNETIVNPIFL